MNCLSWKRKQLRYQYFSSLSFLWKGTCPATWFRKSREVLFDYGFKRKGLHEFEGYWIEAIYRKLSFCLFEYALNMQTISCSLEFVYCNWFCSNLNRLFLVRDQSRLEPLWQIGFLSTPLQTLNLFTNLVYYATRSSSATMALFSIALCFTNPTSGTATFKTSVLFSAFRGCPPMVVLTLI